MKRSQSIRHAVSFVLLLFLFLTGACSDRNGGSASVQDGVTERRGTVAQTDVPPFGAELVYLEGDVTVDASPAELGRVVGAASVIRTAADSYAELVFDGNNIMRIQENTVVVLDMEALQPGLELQRGAMAFVLDGLGRFVARDGIRVGTPSAVAGVRGTVFFVAVETADSTYICTCNGTLALQDAEGGNASVVQSYSHRAQRFVRGAGGIETQSAGLLYHDNALMDGLAAKIGVSIPWQGQETGYGY